MIYIEDYRHPPIPLSNQDGWDLSELMGRHIAVTTAAGVRTGIMTAQDSRTLTLAYSRRTRGGRCTGFCVIGKRHIIAIDTKNLF